MGKSQACVRTLRPRLQNKDVSNAMLRSQVCWALLSAGGIWPWGLVVCNPVAPSTCYALRMAAWRETCGKPMQVHLPINANSRTNDKSWCVISHSSWSRYNFSAMGCSVGRSMFSFSKLPIWSRLRRGYWVSEPSTATSIGQGGWRWPWNLPSESMDP